jgi:hypothetical protein
VILTVNAIDISFVGPRKCISIIILEGRPGSKDSLRISLAQGLCLGSFLYRPSHSPDLAQSDFHLFTHLKQFLNGTRMRRDGAKKTVKDWFNELATDFYDPGIQKLNTRYDQCPNLHGGV